MRTLALLVGLSLTALAGCTAADDPALDLPADVPASAPPPVSIHEVVNLVQGGSTGWSFDVAPNATAVDIRFYATGKAVVGTGLPTCLSWTTPDGSDAAGICQGGGAGNINVAPYIVANERVFYEKGSEATPGHYTFALEAEPSATDFHAVVTVTY